MGAVGEGPASSFLESNNIYIVLKKLTFLGKGSENSLRKKVGTLSADVKVKGSLYRPQNCSVAPNPWWSIQNLSLYIMSEN